MNHFRNLNFVAWFNIICMKHDIKVLILLLALVLPIIAYAQGKPTAELTFAVRNDSGQLLAGVPVNLVVLDHSEPGPEWGEPIYKVYTSKTDAKGTVTLKAPSLSHDVSFSIQNFPGYYEAGGVYTYKSQSFNRWSPWNPTVEIVLEKIGVRAPMYFKKISDMIPRENKPLGFDLMAGDWVAPYGKGRISDFIFKVEIPPVHWVTNWYGTQPRPYPLRSGMITLSFSNEGDGIQSTSHLPYSRQLPRMAPLDGYDCQLVKTQRYEVILKDHGQKLVKWYSNLEKEKNYFFRVRTTKNGNGTVTSMLYGKITGEFDNDGAINDKISFTYYLNPDPNDRNMEFDPNQNLFTDSRSLRGITAP